MASSTKSSRFQVKKSNPNYQHPSKCPTCSAIDLCFLDAMADPSNSLSLDKKAASTEVHLPLLLTNASPSIGQGTINRQLNDEHAETNGGVFKKEYKRKISLPVVPSLRKVSSSGRFTILGPPAGASQVGDGLSGNLGQPTARRRDTSSAGPEILPPLPSSPRSQQSARASTSTLNDVLAVATEEERGVNMSAKQNGASDMASAILAVGRSVHFNVGEARENNEEPSLEGDTSFDNMVTSHKSWRYVETLEHPPIMDFYRNTMGVDGVIASRPSMLELLNGETGKSEFEEFKEDNVTLVESQMVADEQEMINFSKINKVKSKSSKIAKPEISYPHTPAPSTPRSKFGWVEGVFFRCLLNIFGVMLYLRVSWVAGQAGIGLGCMIVLLASAVTTITALSTCAICTNGVIKGGGAYFLISRSLGPEFGGSIGLIFSVANAVGAAMYVVGFAETVRDLLREYSIVIIDGGLNDVRLIGLATCIFLMVIVFIGTSFESKMQMGLLVILSLSICDYFVGSVLPVNDEKRLRGITGYSFDTIKENFLPSFRDGHNFFSVFSIYFPAATGIMAGANISGDLTDPQRAIPLGTLIAILVTTMVYLMTVFATGSTCLRDADGVNFPQLLTDISYQLNGTATGNEMSTVEPAMWKSYQDPECLANNTCSFGLMNYFQVMEIASVWGPLITAGIFAATLSSALASLVSAPKIFQAVCKDRLFPYINYFAKGFGKDEEPRRAYALGFMISMAMILIGDLNAIAPIISNFFLCSYALINYACFDNSFAHSPGFRPGFRFYNMWVSLFGTMLCVTVMFIVSWFTALLTFFFFALLFMYIYRRKPDVNWGCSTQAHSYRNAIQGVTRLEHTDEHVKNYRPQVLVLTGNPATRPSLVDFVHNITKGNSLMICGCVIPYTPSDHVFGMIRRLNEQLRSWLKKRHIKSFFACVANPNCRLGAQSLLQSCGLGKLRPNILIIGFKQNWAKPIANLLPEQDNHSVDQSSKLFTSALADINNYFGIIQDAFDSNMGVAVFRSGSIGGLDFSDTMRLHDLFNKAMPHVSSASNVDVANGAKPENKKQANSFVDPRKPDEVHLTVEATQEDAFEKSPLDILNDYLDDEEIEEEERTAVKDVEAQIPISSYSDANESIQSKDKSHSLSNNHYFYLDPTVAQINGSNQELKPLLQKLNETENDRPEKEVQKKTQQPYIGLQDTQSPSAGFERGMLRRRSTRRLTIAQRELLLSINRFQRKIKFGTIDVWWLYDDGGLTLLIPYLLTLPKSYLENAKMRIFTIATSTSGIEQEQRNMATLLSKFRIEYSDLHVIADISKKPKKETQAEFDKLIAPFLMHDNANSEKAHVEGLISATELSGQREKSMRQLRMAELLQQHSTDADLVVLSLPVPRRGLVSSTLYMAWIDLMTSNLPPTLLVRGNQQSVLTFYS